MILQTFHTDTPLVLWCVISLAFMILSFIAMIIFWHGVKRSAELTAGTFRRVYGLDVAWGFLIDEIWRFTQHFTSLSIGVLGMFVTVVPKQTNIPQDARDYLVLVTFVIFYLNVASGINTVRTIRTWRRRERLLDERNRRRTASRSGQAL